MDSVDDAEQEVFLKTLAFFCATIEHGCPFLSESHSISGSDFRDEDEDEGIPEAATPLYVCLCDMRSRDPEELHCQGKLVFQRNELGRPFLQ